MCIRDRAYHRTYGAPVLITRSSNNYGPWQYPEKIIPLFITNAIDGQALPVYGDGLNVRDWLYVDDNCAGIDAVLRKGALGEVYNIGGGNEVKNLALTHHILELLGKSPELIRFVADRPGHDRRYSCLLYTSDAADDLLCVDLGGRRIIKKKKKRTIKNK